jgi:hypothetical protein
MGGTKQEKQPEQKIFPPKAAFSSAHVLESLSNSPERLPWDVSGRIQRSP